MKKIAQIIATMFYVGYAPVVPATFGAAVAAIAYWFLMPPSPLIAVLVTVALIAIAIVTSGKAEEKYGKDGRPIVIDEVAGMFVSLCFIPRSWPFFLASFVVFRVFDILKPFPAGRAQRLSGGWGVTADDVFAGIYTNVLIRILLAARGV